MPESELLRFLVQLVFHVLPLMIGFYISLGLLKRYRIPLTLLVRAAGLALGFLLLSLSLSWLVAIHPVLAMVGMVAAGIVLGFVNPGRMLQQ